MGQIDDKNLLNDKVALTEDALEQVAGGKVAGIASEGGIAGVASDAKKTSNAAFLSEGALQKKTDKGSNARMSSLKADGTISRF